ncbi:MAG: hypothetical protein KIG62_03515 [Oscillospiraceae bacterium]|nr:hypothetical protein [Oscillospiraceae bacterium]
MAFAFGIISRLLLLFGLADVGLFAVVTLCCFLLFGLLYTAVYLITSGSYYKIVSGSYEIPVIVIDEIISSIFCSSLPFDFFTADA